MQLLQISPTSEHERFDVSLDGTVYTCDLDWNERAGLWFLSLSLPTAEGSVSLMRSCPCVVNLPLTLGLVDDTWAGGALVIEGDRDPERDDWGTHAFLYYASAGEITAVEELSRADVIAAEVP